VWRVSEVLLVFFLSFVSSCVWSEVALLRLPLLRLNFRLFFSLAHFSLVLIRQSSAEMVSQDSPLSGGTVQLKVADGGGASLAHLISKIDPNNHVVMIDNCEHLSCASSRPSTTR
jgi:hypothetical protein